MADLDLTAIEAAVHAAGVWRAPWTARTFEIECPCPNGVHCGEPHTCEEVEALEEYPCGEPEAPAKPGAGQCVLWIDVPGMETFAGPTAAAICALRNNADALVEAARERDRLRALLAAYGRAVEETARVRRDPDRYLDAAAAEYEAEKAVKAEAAKWREWR